MTSHLQIILNNLNNLNNEVCKKTKIYINKLDSEQQVKLNKCNNSKDLSILCYEFGILPVLRYLYEFERITYNFNLLSNTVNTIASENNSEFASAQSNGYNSSLNIIFGGKNEYGKRYCYNYLHYMKKYSVMTFKNKQFFYTINKKNIDDNKVNKMTDDWMDQLCKDSFDHKSKSINFDSKLGLKVV
ncbi:hypothetical protein Catovirus_1_402 [Catovirus CTV1]|uniref:Uncharacterized protein n=1 Tax=Catovirus CTV1 TaxID=1977631 RepID=A0A1V0S9H3_9VIRU|nr:hypothetical protein Catovirus_1_402 [Catovirus CTV1]